MLLALAAAAASVYFFVIRSKFAPYQALAELNQSPELSMNLLLDADMGEEAFELSASVERKTAGGHRVTRVGFDDLPLLLRGEPCGAGKRHGVSAHVRFPDYSAILSNLTSIYQQTSFTTLKNGDETVYGVSVDTDGAETPVGLLLPETAADSRTGRRFRQRSIWKRQCGESHNLRLRYTEGPGADTVPAVRDARRV